MSNTYVINDIQSQMVKSEVENYAEDIFVIDALSP